MSQDNPSLSPQHPQPPLQSSHVWHDWVELSTLHGIIELRAHHYGKLWKATWIFVMIAFTALAVWNIEEGISQYISNPTVQNYQELTRNTFPLPDISICTYARLNFSILSEMGASSALVETLRGRFEFMDPTDLLNPTDPRTWISMAQAYHEFRARNGNITFEEIQHRAGFKCDQILKKCSWREPCCESGTPFLDNTYGMCHRVKTGRKSNDWSEFWYEQSWPGPSAGYQLVLTPVSEQSTIDKQGVLVDFVYPNESPSFTYFDIPTGVIATVRLSLQVTERINMMGRPQTCSEPKSDKIADLDGRLTLDALLRSANGCYFASWSKSVLKFCGCTSLNVADIPLCEPFDFCQWGHPQLRPEFYRIRSECLPQCHRRSYAVSITYSKLDVAAFRKRHNMSTEDYKDENLIFLNVFHPYMEYLHVLEVEVYSIMNLVSNIGGALGLWLGASLMSILQLAFYFFKWLSVRKEADQSLA